MPRIIRTTTVFQVITYQNSCSLVHTPPLAPPKKLINACANQPTWPGKTNPKTVVIGYDMKNPIAEVLIQLFTLEVNRKGLVSCISL